MFRKVHLRLAGLCAGITAVILLAMSLGCLYVSEKGLRDNSFISFQNDMNTVIGNLEQQTVITHEWLSKMEDHGKYLIHLTDNGVPFFFNSRSSDAETLLFETALREYETRFPDDTQTEDSFHTEFSFSASGRGAPDHYACVAVDRRGSGSFQALILAPQLQLQRQIRMQRILFLLLDAAALCALGLFAWHFTRILLEPLEESRRQQARFVSAASHELRTPLAVILSCASAAERADGTKRRHFLESIRSEGSRMSRLIDDMLLLTRADSHGWTIRREPTELDTLLLDACETFEPMASEKRLRLTPFLPGHPVPACRCDRERIYQVLFILLHNAVSYTPEGGQIRVSLDLDEQKKFRIRVADDGIGIPDAEKAHIFERFYRADQSRSQKGHFGLGLCIASEIALAHRGSLSVEDTPGGGSTFLLRLP
ncbi:MAG: HAMP domain-containing sensor histidine kinase [Eubacteriales bacterium]|nr:HAMP domain-containing sensor histidine kinase [Eubacteriales bacterium]